MLSINFIFGTTDAKFRFVSSVRTGKKNLSRIAKFLKTLLKQNFFEAKKN